MAKKKRIIEQETAGQSGSRSDSINEFNDLRLADDLYNQLPEGGQDEISALLFLISMGYTPQEYEHFYNIFQSGLGHAEPEIDSSDDDWETPPVSPWFGKIQRFVKEYGPLEHASEHTLTLKVQMKGVTKPPMWREVEIPANYTFDQLHMVIQTAVGLENCHLWQFGISAYDPGLIIGLRSNGPHEMGVDDITHDATKTPVTQFLQQKGDKLEYVYDFGDDWIFTVEVKSLTDKKIDHPLCKKYKCELNAIEDFGGVWAYLSARQDIDEWASLSKKEQRQHADNFGFDSPNEYIDFLNDCKFDLPTVNDRLMTL